MNVVIRRGECVTLIAVAGLIASRRSRSVYDGPGLSAGNFSRVGLVLYCRAAGLKLNQNLAMIRPEYSAVASW